MTDTTSTTAPPEAIDLFPSTKTDNRAVVGTTHAERVADAIAQLTDNDELSFDPNKPTQRDDILALLQSKEYEDQRKGVSQFTTVVSITRATKLQEQLIAIDRPAVSQETKDHAIKMMFSKHPNARHFGVKAANNLIDGTWDEIPRREGDQSSNRSDTFQPVVRPARDNKPTAESLGFKLPSASELDFSSLGIPSVEETNEEREAKKAAQLAEAVEIAGKVTSHVSWPAFCSFVEENPEGNAWVIDIVENPQQPHQAKAARAHFTFWSYRPDSLMLVRNTLRSHEWAACVYGTVQQSLGFNLEIGSPEEAAFLENLAAGISSDTDDLTDEVKAARSSLMRANALAAQSITAAVTEEEKVTVELKLVEAFFQQGWESKIPSWANECLENAFDVDRPVGPEVPWHERDSIRTAIDFLFENFYREVDRNPYMFIYREDTYEVKMAAQSFLDDVIARNQKRREKSASKRMGINVQPEDASGKGRPADQQAKRSERQARDRAHTAATKGPGKSGKSKQ